MNNQMSSIGDSISKAFNKEKTYEGIRSALHQGENVLVYVDEASDLEELCRSAQGHPSCRMVRFTELNMQDADEPGAVIYFTNIGFDARANLRLLNAFKERQINKIYKVQDSELQHMLG